MVNHIVNPKARRQLPHMLGKVYFNPRTLNDLRMKTRDVKEFIQRNDVSDDEVEFKVYGLLAHLNNLMFDIE
jgi:hypothetical protein